MANSNFPFYDQRNFNIRSINEFSLNIFNPYSLYYYTVSIITPVFPNAVVAEIERPEIKFRDFLDWCGSYVDIEDEKHALYHLVNALLLVGSEYVDVNFVGPNTYKRAVCYYAGHYLEQHLKVLKDEANSTNFNPEEKDKVIKMDIPLGSKEDFRQTITGQMFWSIYGSIARLSGQGDKSIWGAF